MDRKEVVTVVALILVTASLPLTWEIAEVREVQAVEEKTADLQQTTVNQRHTPSDYDGDGISDSEDECPTRPETQNGFQDGDGCPDVVATTGAS